jgi:hypothetical protein
MTSLAADAVSANKFYETVTQNILGGDQYSAAERKDIDVLMRKRDRLLARIAKIETNLITIQKDGVLIKKHCSATPDEVQAAIQAYKQKHYDAECLVVGMKFQLQNLKGQAPKALSIKLRPLGLGLLSSWVGVMRSSAPH